MSAIEPLESRIAPATIIISYIDRDDDVVKIKASTSSSTVPPLDAADLTFLGGGTSGQLTSLNLTDPAFAGASITFTVVRKPGGDGFAHVGHIDATGINLGNVTVKGDLGIVDAGDGTGTALKSLVVRSMGVFANSTQSGTELESDLVGDVGSIKVLTDLKDAHLNLTGGPDIHLGKFTIGRDLIGGTNDRSGSLTTTGSVGAIKIGGNIIGGSDYFAGGIDVFRSIGSVSVGGSVIGNHGYFLGSAPPAQFHEGQIFAGTDIGTVKVRGDLIGGPGVASGEIRAGGKIVSVTIGGSIFGGGGSASGHLNAEGNLGPVKIGGSIFGGSGDFSGLVTSLADITSISVGGSIVGTSANQSGAIIVTGAIGSVKIAGNFIGGSLREGDLDSSRSGYISAQRITSVSIGGSILAGYDASNDGALSSNATINVHQDLALLTVKGSLVGNPSTPVTIFALGENTTATIAPALGKIIIGGNVEYTQILAGYLDGMASNGNAQIGSVTVSGDWRASSLVAGINDTDSNGFGNADDAVIAGPPGADTDAILSRIASITIKGLIQGTAINMLDDHYGFTAQQVGAFAVNGTTLSLTTGTDALVSLAPFTGDVFLREV